MIVDMYNFIDMEEYQIICNSLKDNETKMIYCDDNIDIQIKKEGRKIFTFINTYGDKSLSEVLNNICILL